MGETFEESNIFDASLSIWKGIKANKDGTFSYESEDFDPIPLDLYTAASLGEVEIIQDILDKKEVRVNSTNAGGWSALMYASYMGHNSTVQHLIEGGADPNLKNPQGYSSLILASLCGNENTMGALIQKGADIESKDKRGWTALFHAASSGHQQTTDFLLKVGSNFEIVEPSQGLTPLMEAAASGHELIVQQLLLSGADATRQDYQGENAATLALAYGHTKIVSLIDQFKNRKQRQAGYNYQKNNSNRNSESNKCGHSGPSIHAGPKAFAAMTGLDSEGKLRPHPTVPVFLQDQPSHITDVVAKSPKWDGPKNLETLLNDIGCSKYYPVFKDQDVDLQIFLTLSEADLKEIGITLFGPRRKMESVINRLTSDIQTRLTDRPEAAYADGLSAKLQVAQTKLKQMKESRNTLEAQVAQERELRRVTEGVLVGHKEVWSSLRHLSDKCASTQAQLGQGLDQVRACIHESLKTLEQHGQNKAVACIHESEKLSSLNRNSRREKQDALKLMKDVDVVYRCTRDFMLDMQAILQRAISSTNFAPDKSKSPT